jgi:hypothetical protein
MALLGHWFFFLSQCNHMSLMDFVVLPPGFGGRVTDVWGWGAHRALLCCPDYVSDNIYMYIYIYIYIYISIWEWSTRKSLKPKFYKVLRPWSLWGSSPARENSHHKTENRTWDLMTSSQKFWPPSHEAVHLAIARVSIVAVDILTDNYV